MAEGNVKYRYIAVDRTFGTRPRRSNGVKLGVVPQPLATHRSLFSKRGAQVNHVSWVFAVAVFLSVTPTKLIAQSAPAEGLPGTKRLDWTDDIASRMGTGAVLARRARTCGRPARSILGPRLSDECCVQHVDTCESRATRSHSGSARSTSFCQRFVAGRDHQAVADRRRE